MGKLWVEVCLISARGLRRSSSLWKLQWYAVGWTNPNNKYCTKIDAPGNASPVWKTKFATLVEGAETKLNDLALHIEVYSREPIFLRERLQGTATILLKEFLAKHKNSENSRHGAEEVGSYQLRKKNSNKPQDFVDVSIHISEDMEGRSSYTGNEGGPGDYSNTITLATGDGSAPALLSLTPQKRSEHQFQMNSPYANPMRSTTKYSRPSQLDQATHQQADQATCKQADRAISHQELLHRLHHLPMLAIYVLFSQEQNKCLRLISICHHHLEHHILVMELGQEDLLLQWEWALEYWQSVL